MSVRLTRGIEVVMGLERLVIERVDYHHGLVELRRENGVITSLSLEELLDHPHLAEAQETVTGSDAALERLGSRERSVFAKRLAHFYEAETGYRSGTSQVALSHEPLPQYDPALTTVGQRRLAKARELDNEHAADAGTKMSVRTLERMSQALKTGQGLDAIVDRRHVRRLTGPYSVTPEVAAACEEVFEKTRLDSTRTHAARYLLVKQYMREVFGYAPGQEPLPHERTIRRWFQDRYVRSELNGKARTRRSATSAPARGFSRPNPTRPGELVCIDTCSLDVLLAGTTFAGAVRGVLVMAVDWYSRSIVALRVLERAERAIDVTFVLREIAKPKTMLPGWDDDNRWPFVGLPEYVVADLYDGGGYLGLPVVNPETVVTDHGSTYKAHINVATATQQGISILPARVRKPADKQVVERTFGSLRTMLLQLLSGYRGSDTADRGSDVDAQVRYTAQDIEDLACLWAARVWQNHELTDARPDWCPEGRFSPNTLYEYGLAQTGIPLRALSSEDYYGLLPAKAVKVNSRGVRVLGLYYDGEALNEPMVRNHPSPYGGADRGKWTVRYDPRDLRRVFFLDANGVYRRLTWTGASPHTPCFNDRHAAALSKLRRDRGIGAHEPHALAEILLTDVLASHESVRDWPTLSKAARQAIRDRSRVHRQEEMVRRDQAVVGLPAYGDDLGDEPSAVDLMQMLASDDPQVSGAHLDADVSEQGSKGQPEASVAKLMPVNTAHSAPAVASPIVALDLARTNKNAAGRQGQQAVGPATTAPSMRSAMPTPSTATSLLGIDVEILRAARQAVLDSQNDEERDPGDTEHE